MIIVMPDSMSVERRRLMAAYGAEVVLTPGSLGMAASVEEPLCNGVDFDAEFRTEGQFAHAGFFAYEYTYLYVVHEEGVVDQAFEVAHVDAELFAVVDRDIEVGEFLFGEDAQAVVDGEAVELHACHAEVVVELYLQAVGVYVACHKCGGGHIE